jgi:hypothetical protein
VEKQRLDLVLRAFLVSVVPGGEREAAPFYHLLISELFDADQVIRVKLDDDDALLVSQGSDLSLVQVDGTAKRVARTELPLLSGVTLKEVREIDDDVVPVEWTVIHPKIPSGRFTVDAQRLHSSQRAEVWQALRVIFGQG